jgi:hypothetical protein
MESRRYLFSGERLRYGPARCRRLSRAGRPGTCRPSPTGIDRHPQSRFAMLPSSSSASPTELAAWGPAQVLLRRSTTVTTISLVPVIMTRSVTVLRSICCCSPLHSIQGSTRPNHLLSTCLRGVVSRCPTWSQFGCVTSSRDNRLAKELTLSRAVMLYYLAA